MSFIKKSTTNSYKDLFLKAAHFCAYQERTQEETRTKLLKLGATVDEAEEVICQLIIEDYLNEERFAKVFAGGKFRIKKWGKLKIKQQLKLKGVSKRNIEAGIQEIDDEEYSKTLLALIEKRSASEKETDPFKKNFKIASHLINKGYEPDIVWEVVKEKFPV